jgi:Flp pilus assembly protein TadG
VNRRAVRDEAGVYVVYLAVLIVALLAIAALVIDLASLRQDRATNRSAADLAATSAALSLSESNLADMPGACQAAWGYLVESAGSGTIDCSPFATACNATAPRSTTGTLGRYTVTITNPVTDLTPDAIGGATQPADANVDGAPCERIAVQITEQRPFAFAGIVGAKTGTTTSRSVGRALTNGDAGETDALIVLEDTDCQALVASGQGKVHVKAAGDSPGGIIVDSNGTTNCNGQKRVIELDHNNGRIIADAGAAGRAAAIRQFALAPGQGNARAFDPDDVATGHLSPAPTPRRRPVTRAPVDWEFNCKAAGRDGIAGTADDCAGATGFDDHIDQLRVRYGGPGAPAGFPTYAGPCTTGPNDPPITVVGNVFVNCPTFKVANTVRFRDGDVVFAGAIDVQGGSLSINDAPNDNPMNDHIAYLRAGGLDKDAQGEVHLPKVFVYLANGIVDLGAGGGKVLWTAPYSGDFDKLALWSESSAAHAIGGQASLSLDGVFFTPNATMNFTGQGSFDQVRAQFISNKLVMSGQGELVMQPDPSRVVLVPVVGSRLIR